MYKVPKNGATVTIYAPYDCGNNCPFCVNKKEYKDNPTFDIKAVKEAMYRMDMITPKCDFVITGGEPLADLDKFEELVMSVATMNLGGSRHKLFVNTTLPVTKKDIYRLNKLKHIISGFNISRHINNYINESDDILIGLLQIPVRINCVLYTDEESLYANEIITRFEHYKNITGFQFRDDYRDVDYDNLYNCNWNRKLNNLLKGLGKTIDNCEFNFSSFRWDCIIQNKPLIKFHRTMCYSKIEYDDYTEINDIIINPRGEILDDWNQYGARLDIKEYKKGLKNS